jgi:ribosomal protein S18 acetylase RimI-like enzyme
MISIRSLKDAPDRQLYLAFSEAFANYITSWSEDAFHRMLHRRGYSPSLSFGAFDDDHLVSFTFNGIGEYNGLRTAYDTGTGTLPDYRGHGLATLIFTESMPQLISHGVQQYLLEVLQDNETATSIYAKQGFEITRALNVFRIANDSWPDDPLHANVNVELRQIDFSLEKEMISMWDFSPAWQNSFSALRRNPDHFVVLGAYIDGLFVGYGIIEPESGDIPQLAVDKAMRRSGIGSQLLQALRNYNQAPITRVVNTDAAYHEMTLFLNASGLPIMARQFEMIKSL